MKLNKIAISALCLVMAAQMSDAKVKLPGIISDNMVLEQQTEANLWGSTQSKKKVKVTTSWNKKDYTVKADKNGNWKLAVATPNAGGPYTITFDDGDKTVISNVLIGEVWYCSGQSNMGQPMKGYPSQPTGGSIDAIINAKPQTPIRICMVSGEPAKKASEVNEAQWFLNEPEHVAEASATAYYFALHLQKALNIPVGIIVCAWGGSTVQSWMSRDVISRDFKEFDLSFLDNSDPNMDRASLRPCTMFNGKVAPLTNYTIKGFNWYQGEGNIDDPELYSRLLPAYAKMMRNLWGQGDIPFHYVQIAPFKYTPDKKAALIREAQLKAMDIIPNSGMVVTLDIGNPDCVHPMYKSEVGQRLSYLALDKAYHIGGFDGQAPRYKNMEVKGNVAYINCETGDYTIAPVNKPLAEFEIAGEDKVFHPADAKIRIVNKQGQIMVSSPKVKHPVAVRYCFRNAPTASVFNSFGLPLAPFRTDDWEY